VSGVIRWEEPPAQHGNSKAKPPAKYQAVADEMRARPSVWAIVLEGKAPGTCGNLGYRIRNGVAGALVRVEGRRSSRRPYFEAVRPVRG
jgi:hypothetical protein